MHCPKVPSTPPPPPSNEHFGPLSMKTSKNIGQKTSITEQIFLQGSTEGGVEKALHGAITG